RGARPDELAKPDRDMAALQVDEQALLRCDRAYLRFGHGPQKPGLLGPYGYGVTLWRAVPLRRAAAGRRRRRVAPPQRARGAARPPSRGRRPPPDGGPPAQGWPSTSVG